MNLRLDEKYGANPTMILCFICNEPRGDIALLGKLNAKQKRALEDAKQAQRDPDQAPRYICLDEEPCDACRAHMDAGIILISVRDGETSDNPYRTGGWVVIREEAVDRWGIEPPELLAHIKRKRMTFIPDEAWDMLGLPREAPPTEGTEA